MREPPSKYGFPPERHQGIPESVPWDTPISELSGLWLLKECVDCGTAAIPLRRLAADRGWKLTLRTIVPRLLCGQCGHPLLRARLTDDPRGDMGRHGGRSHYLHLSGEPKPD